MKKIKYLTMIFTFLSFFLFITFIMTKNYQYDINKESDSFMDDNISNDYESIKYQEIQKKVIPYIVTAKVIIDNQEVIAEVIEDKQNGMSYCLNINNENKWFENYYVTIIDPIENKVSDLTNEEIEYYVNKSNFTSLTEYFIWVDIYRNETYLLKKDDDQFQMIKRIPCATGKNITPTKRGLYTISNKGTHFFGRTNTYMCYNFLQYSGSYLLHSFPYSLDKKVLDDTLYDRVSNGCVRYNFEDSKYLYDTIPLNTAIWLN